MTVCLGTNCFVCLTCHESQPIWDNYNDDLRQPCALILLTSCSAYVAVSSRRLAESLEGHGGSPGWDWEGKGF